MVELLSIYFFTLSERQGKREKRGGIQKREGEDAQRKRVGEIRKERERVSLCVIGERERERDPTLSLCESLKNQSIKFLIFFRPNLRSFEISLSLSLSLLSPLSPLSVYKGGKRILSKLFLPSKQGLKNRNFSHY